MEDIKGRTVVINKPAYAIYSAFSNLDNLKTSLPEQLRDKVTIGDDTITASVQGFSLGVKVHSRTPFSRIDFEQYGQSPFPFLASFFMEPSGDNATFFHIELHAQLGTMMKMMIGKRLQEAVDKLTDGIASAASGNIPAAWADVTR